MNLTYTDYIELPAPLVVARAALLDPATWSLLPIGAERVGEMWRWGSDLYTVRCEYANEPADDDHHTLRWEIAPVTMIGTRVRIEVTLYDAMISTHATVRVVLISPQPALPWQHLRYLWRLHALILESGNTLGGLLREQAVPPLARRVRNPAPAPVAAPVGVGVSAEGETATLPDEQPYAIPAAREPYSLTEQLRAHYPQTAASFEAMGALEHLERVCWLEQNWERILDGQYDESCYVRTQTSPATAEYDLIYAGSGLGLIHAAVMAHCYGWRVLVFDRGDVGCAHREWNISRPELQRLVDTGLVTWHELAPVIMREYRNGVVKFYHSPYSIAPPSELWMPDVLNMAVDAGALLRLMRSKLHAAGGTILDRRSFRAVRVPDSGVLRVEVELETRYPPVKTETYTGRLLLDGMGSTSPLALYRHAGRPFAGLCPTVGTVASGFVQGNGPREHDPTIGDILISVADTQNHRQLIWEGFPGRGDALTVYVFYYIALARHQPPHRYSLLDLFEQYFTLLPTYKEPGAEFQHLKPVYGYIPGRHSMRRQEAPFLRGVLPVGDSAAQQSPLTYCGFGSHIRNLNRTTSLLHYALQHDLTEPEHLGAISPFQANVSLNWVFSRFMESWGRPHNVNEIQNAFHGAMNALGPQLSSRFFKDEMRWSDYNNVVWQMLMRYWVVLSIPWKVLGPQGVLQWIGDYLNFTLEAAYAEVARTAGEPVEQAIYQICDALSPSLGLFARARYAEWRVMKWL